MTRPGDPIPDFLTAALEYTADSLRRSLDGLDYPNKNRGNAPFTEANVIAHFAVGLARVEPGALFYVEAAHGQGQRIDMIAHAGNSTLLVEAKVFGDVARCCESLIGQTRRMPGFSPACWERRDGKPAARWWDDADAVWRLVLLGSHAEVTEAWVEEGASERIKGIYADEKAPPRSLNRYRKHGKALAALMEELGGWTLGHAKVLEKGIFEGTTVDLLWAARRLERTPSVASHP